MTDDQYYTQFGMDKDPFSVITSDSDYFSTPELEHRIELIKHLIEFSDRIVVITGEPGTGKTSLMNHLVCNPDEKWNRCRLEFNSINSVEDFFAQIFTDQNLEYRELDSYPSKVSALQEYFNGLQFKGYIPVIFIDDAHYLSIEILKLLFELAITAQKKPCLHIVLFSETKIADLVNHKNLGYIHSLDMPLFDEQQTAQYIHHRLSEAGYTGDANTTEKFIKQIYRTSAGQPGLINELAQQALMDPALHKTEKKPSNRLQTFLLNPRYTMPAALVLLAAFMSYVFYAEPESEPSKTEEKIVDLPKAAVPEKTSLKQVDDSVVVATDDTGPEPEASSPQSKAPSVSASDATDKTAEASSPQNASEAVEDNESTTMSTTAAPEPLSDSIEVADVLIEVETTPITVEPEPESINETSEPTQIVVLNTQGEIVESISSKSESAPNDLPQRETKKAEPTESETVIQTASENANPAVTSKPNPKTEPKTKPKPEPTVEPVTAASPSVNTSSTVRGTAWLKQQSPGHYVLQLMGAHDGAAMNKFIEQHRQYQADFAKFKTVNQNKVWYVLVYGRYDNRDQAVAAAAKLPPVLRDLKPWPRRIETIQKDL